MRIGGTIVPVAAALLAACAVPDDRAREGSAEQALASYTKQCPTVTVEGVDVYSGDGTIDWSMVASSGRQFAFIKATQGDYNHQSTFAAQWSGAAAAGILRSPYHFFDGTKDGVAQASWFLDYINSAGGGLQDGDLAPLLDLECPTSANASSTQSDCEGFTGGSGWVDNATLKQRVYDFLTTVAQATGRTPIIYSFPSWFASVNFTDAELAAYPLYIASYNSCASVPAPWAAATFWQYSATGTVAGISGTGNVDLDRFVGSDGDLVAQTGGTPDAGIVDAGGSGNPATGDAGTDPAGVHSGCGCEARGGGSPWSVAPILAALGICTRRRRVRKVAHDR
jgi:GH25 family lysozyme M1 (1,4-beta-N-acetylmuramidase)